MDHFLFKMIVKLHDDYVNLTSYVLKSNYKVISAIVYYWPLKWWQNAPQNAGGKQGNLFAKYIKPAQICIFF